MKDIPVKFIIEQVDTLLEVASGMNAEDAFAKALVIRANHYMDLIEAYRESLNKPNG